jgi:hypothetical protein
MAVIARGAKQSSAAVLKAGLLCYAKPQPSRPSGLFDLKARLKE